MKKLILLLSIVATSNLFGQVQPSQNKTIVGQLQNNTGVVQMKGFAPAPPPPANLGGSKIKPNPFMSSADFAFVQNPTYEGGFRTSLSFGFSKSNNFGNSSFGANGMATTDFTQRAVSIYKTYKSFVMSYSFAQIGTSQTSGLSVTKLWNHNNRIFGLQLGYSFVNGDSLRIASPALINFWEKRYMISKNWHVAPSIYTTVTSPYYNRDKKQWEKDFSFNALVGTTFSYNFSKRFVLNLGYRGNINTNPKFGLMNNILIGSNFKF